MAEAVAMGIAHVVWMSTGPRRHVLPGWHAASGCMRPQRRARLALARTHTGVGGLDSHTRSLQCAATGSAHRKRGSVHRSCWFWWDGIHMTPAGAVGLTTSSTAPLGLVLRRLADPLATAPSVTGTRRLRALSPVGGNCGRASSPRATKCARHEAVDTDDPPLRNDRSPGRGFDRAVRLARPIPPRARHVTAVGASRRFVPRFVRPVVPPTRTLKLDRRTFAPRVTHAMAGTSCARTRVDTDLVIDGTAGSLPRLGSRRSPVRLVIRAPTPPGTRPRVRPYHGVRAYRRNRPVTRGRNRAVLCVSA